MEYTSIKSLSVLECNSETIMRTGCSITYIDGFTVYPWKDDQHLTPLPEVGKSIHPSDLLCLLLLFVKRSGPKVYRTLCLSNQGLRKSSLIYAPRNQAVYKVHMSCSLNSLKGVI